MVHGSEDVYRKLLEDDNPPHWLFGLVSFALFEEQRIEWARHWVQQNDREPTHEEIKAWYQQQPDGVLLRVKGEAETAFQECRGKLLHLHIEVFFGYYQSLPNQLDCGC